MSAQKGAAEALRTEIERQRANLEAEGCSLHFDTDADTDIGELIIGVSSAAATGTFRVDNEGFGHFSVLHSSSNQHVNQVTWDQLSPKQTIDRFTEFIREMQEVRDEIPENNVITVQFWDWFRNSYRKSQLPSSPWVAENFSMSATENLAKNPSSECVCFVAKLLQPSDNQVNHQTGCQCNNQSANETTGAHRELASGAWGCSPEFPGTIRESISNSFK